MTTTNKTLSDYLEMDGGIAFNSAIYNRFSKLGEEVYAEICGGYIEGVYQWVDHNIDFVVDSENEKYYGYTIHFNCGAVRRVYIEKWVFKLSYNGLKHAKAVFNKYLKEDVKFNQSEANMSKSYGY
jgi:hypothetical protein